MRNAWRWASLLLLVTTASAETAKPDPALRRVDECMVRIATVLETLTKWEEEARDTNHAARADCLHQQVTSVTGLLEVSRSARRRLEDVVEDDDPEFLQGERDKILAACDRVEKLLAAAADCDSHNDQRSRKSVPTPRPPEHDKIKPPVAERPPWTKPRLPSARSADTCLKQIDLARLLAQAMGLGVIDDAMAVLQQREIEPLDGWEAQACADTDDLYVVTAQALALEVEDEDDPASYAEALRQFGLPVDIDLPRTAPKANPPVLLETEVREFFVKGLASPLPTSRPYVPR